MPHLTLHLCGTFHASVDGEQITKFRTDKARALLAYLAVESDIAHRRDALAALFWEESGASAARANLRNTLSNLKQRLASVPGLLEINRHTVTLHSAHATVDALDFGRNPHTHIDTQRGTFLRGLAINDALAFEEWRMMQQERLHLLAMTTLDQLQAEALNDNAFDRLGELAQQQLYLEAWHEPAHKNLLHALIAQDQLQAAHDQFDRMCEVLDEELGVEPLPETVSFWQQLLAADTTPADDLHNLPTALPPFFGRTDELQKLQSALSERSYRLLTLTGLGGSGKTRLSLELARTQIGSFPDGVWFVALASADSAETVEPTIAETLGLELDDSLPLSEQLHAHLKEKELLLILDNLEQLPETVADVIHDLLLATTKLIIVATSRRRLSLRIETLFPVGGLPVPNEADAHESAQFASIDLFAEQMRRLNPFAVPQDEQATIASICRLVEGLPLGIELAAAQLEQRSLREIETSLSASLQLLETTMRDIPARQRSLRAVFESSWVLLSARLRNILAQLSVFRGGFEQADVEAIIPAAQGEQLARLVSHSLLQADAVGRYDLHPLVREFSAEKIPSDDPITAKHCQHYLDAIADKSSQNERRRDLANVRRAWQWATDNLQDYLLSNGAAALSEYMQSIGQLRAGDDLFTRAISRFEEAGNKATRHRETLAKLIGERSPIAASLRGTQVAIDDFERALVLTSSDQLRYKLLGLLSAEYGELGQFSEAQLRAEKQTEIAKRLGDETLVVDAMLQFATVQALHFVGDIGAIIENLESAYAIVEANDSAGYRQRRRVLRPLYNATMRHGSYDRSIELTIIALDETRQTGDQLNAVTDLLALGLTYGFAGMLDESIETNLEALALAQEIEDIEGVGLLSTNIGLSYRRSGDLEKGLQFATEGVNQLAALGIRRMEGMARNRLGITCSPLAVLMRRTTPI